MTRTPSRSASVTRSESRTSSATKSESRAPTPSPSFTAYGTGSSTPASTVTATTSPGSYLGASIGLLGGAAGASSASGDDAKSSTLLYAILGAVLGFFVLLSVGCAGVIYLGMRKMKRIKGLVRGRPGGEGRAARAGGDDYYDDEAALDGDAAAVGVEGDGGGDRLAKTQNPMASMRAVGGVADAGLALKGSKGGARAADKISFGVTAARGAAAVSSLSRVTAPSTSAAAAALGFEEAPRLTEASPKAVASSAPPQKSSTRDAAEGGATTNPLHAKNHGAHAAPAETDARAFAHSSNATPTDYHRGGELDDADDL